MISGGVAPQHVGDAVVIEVSSAGRRPSARMYPDIVAARPVIVDDLPQVDIAGRRIVPKDVAGAVVREIADRCDMVAGRMRADIDAFEPNDRLRSSTLRHHWSLDYARARRSCRRD